MYEEHCSKDVQNFTHYAEDVLQALRKIIPKPDQLDKTYDASCWHDSINLFPLMEYWKSHNQLHQPTRWNFQFDSDEQAERLYNQTLATKQKRLICIPNVYFGGFPKCGSTQLYNLLVTHPLLQGPRTKETHWWAKRIHYIRERNAHPYKELSVIGYLTHFSKLTECASKTPSCLGVDASVSLFSNDINHFGICELPHLFHEIIPNAKFIVILRNPTARLYSNYWYFMPKEVKGTNYAGPKVFHKLVERQIMYFNDCMKKYDNAVVCIKQQAITDAESIMKITEHLGHGLYYINIQKWLAVFPKENFIFIRTEDLHNNPKEIVGSIWKFLGLPVSYGSDFNRQSKKEALHQTYPPMLPETKVILDNFYREYNEKLSELLNDDRYMWNDH